jgi:glycosyltransferase involved in cell wall biosynthesis
VSGAEVATAREPVPPRVAVIIPVLNRVELLRRTFDALDRQTFSDFEVVVVDDGSTDGSREEAEARLVAGRRVRVLRNPGRGSMAARQHGATSTSAELLAFTDSDCEPVPRWLEALVAEADQGGDVVAGPTVPARPPRLFERTMDCGDNGGYPTCNILYRRDRFDEVGGFAPDAYQQFGFRVGSRGHGLGLGEDTLLGWKVRRNGGRPGFAPDAVVRHFVFPPDYRELIGRSRQAGFHPVMLKAIPELRETLVSHRLVLGARSRLLLYPAAVALITGRRKAAAAALTAWAALRVRRSTRAGTSPVRAVAVLPVELVDDAVVSAALLWGSARARSLVL